MNQPHGASRPLKQSAHPSQEELERFADDKSTASENRAVVRHLLAGCAKCGAAIASRVYFPSGESEMKEGSQSQLVHEDFRSLIKAAFRPGEAAFVLHLSQCQSCRELAKGLLTPLSAQEEGESLKGLGLQRAKKGEAKGPSPEVDIILTFTRVIRLYRLAFQPPPVDDLNPAELQNFLKSLDSKQDELIRHLLVCRTCQKASARSLAPSDRTIAASNSLMAAVPL